LDDLRAERAVITTMDVDAGLLDAALSDATQPLLAEHADLERALADPELHSDPARARAIGRRYAELGQVVEAHRALLAAAGDAATARELAADDPDFAAELPVLEEAHERAHDRLRRLLVPRDPDDERDVILEIKAGEGGEESALFAGDLLRMYLRYAERQGWRTEVLDRTESDLGGFKDVAVAVKSRGTPAPGEGVYARMKFEGGVHRVQRVPVTESQGRIHTSAAGVLVLPEVEDVEVEINPDDLRIDVFRSSGPGGQSVNTTDSAVRITHLPTGIVVSCQNEKSQLQNKEQALRILRARLHAIAVEVAQSAAAQTRRAQVRTVDRSERIRTYNYPENRIADHRTGYKAYNLDQVLDGDLEPVIASAVQADEAARLADAEAAGALTRQDG
jgi:peptide chain release factor 1